ncbi:hypothetical protein [Hymenobacter ginkgonis]|nr:hypothetical protein [Hymenobacter ginkgonis]
MTTARCFSPATSPVLPAPASGWAAAGRAGQPVGAAPQHHHHHL